MQKQERRSSILRIRGIDVRFHEHFISGCGRRNIDKIERSDFEIPRERTVGIDYAECATSNTIIFIIFCRDIEWP